MLEEIKQKVQQKVSQSNNLIVMGLYSNMVQSHNDFCDCNYCSILKKYVSLKKQLHDERRKEEMELDMQLLTQYSHSKKHIPIYYLEQKVKELKIEKDKLKNL